VNEDGSPTELIGFRVYAGVSDIALQWVLTVDANQTTAIIEGLPLGTVYFAVTAVNITGGESAFSIILSKTNI
jgi:hypothetical protein